MLYQSYKITKRLCTPVYFFLFFLQKVQCPVIHFVSKSLNTETDKQFTQLIKQ